MTPRDLLSLLPLVITAGTAVVVMLTVALRRSHRLTAGLTLLGLAAGCASVAVAWGQAPGPITTLLVVDRYGLLYTAMILAATLVTAMLSYPYLAAREGKREEYYILLLLATMGAATLAASTHFASFFLGLELLSVALYALVAYPRGNPLSTEAGVKYLILAGVSSAFLLFGMGLIYAALGTMEFSRLATGADSAAAPGLVTVAGVAMILVGTGFKLSLAPFHLWAPDVYQGAPAPTTAFVATVSKGAVFALLLRYCAQAGVHSSVSLVAVLTLLAVVSMFVGNWLALLQTNIKRLLAYSSIAHMGYLLVALLASGPWAATAVAYYLSAYFVTMLGALGTVSLLSTPARDADAVEDYVALAWRRPWAAAGLTLMLLSLAGIPLTAGFIGKFYVLAAGVHSNLWLLVVTLVANSAIGLFYYLRIIVAMFRQPAEATATPAAVAVPLMTCAALVILAAALIWLGIAPAPTIRLIQAAMAG